MKAVYTERCCENGRDGMNNLITIGELSKITGISTRTIRHYESVGLLDSTCSTSANYRLYGAEEIKRLEKILIFKNLGFSLEDIKLVLSTSQNEEVIKVFNKNLIELEKKEKEILHYKNMLTAVTKIYEMKGLDYVNNYYLLGEIVNMNSIFTKTFNKLELELQIKILIELYHTGNISVDTMKQIGTESGTRLLNDLHMIVVKTLLNKVNRKVEKNIMESLEKRDAEFAEDLKRAMFTFEDLIMLSDENVEKWLKKCSDKELIIALSESGNSVRSKVYKNMPIARTEMMKEGIESLHVPTLDEIYEATTSLIEILKNMDYLGEISIERGHD